jgi:hypothetical protein
MDVSECMKRDEERCHEVSTRVPGWPPDVPTETRVDRPKDAQYHP